MLGQTRACSDSLIQLNNAIAAFIQHPSHWRLFLECLKSSHCIPEEIPLPQEEFIFPGFIGTLILDRICLIAKKPKESSADIRSSALCKSWVYSTCSCCGPLYLLAMRTKCLITMETQHCKSQRWWWADSQKDLGRVTIVKASQAVTISACVIWETISLSGLKCPTIGWWAGVSWPPEHMGYHGTTMTP